MAENSILWTTGTSGDGTSTYTQTQTTDAFRDLFVSDNYATQGVLVGNGGELAVTGTSTPVAVASGAAVVYGFLYRNTAAVTFAVATPVVGTTAHRIVLRADYSARTVRLAKLSATDGVNTPPAVTQIANTTWEISIATLSITTGGVITVTMDPNRFAHYPTAVATENIDDGAVTAPKLAAAVAGNGLAGGAGTALSVNTDGSTLEISSDTLRIKDLGVSTAKLADLSVTASKIASLAVGNGALQADSVQAAQIASDSVDDTKVGNRVAQFYRRQGGSSSAWGSAGSTDYTPTSVRMQGGAVSFSAGASTTTTQGVTFPVAFSNTPLVFITQQNSPTQDITVSAIASSTSVTISAKNDGLAGDTVSIAWLAIGPE